MTVDAECAELVPRVEPGVVGAIVLVDLAVTDTVLEVFGHSQVAIPVDKCQAGSLRAGTSTLFTVSGSPDLPGLVPANFTITASLPEHPLDPLLPVAPGQAVGNVTPEAIIDYEVIAGDVLPAASDGGVSVPIQVLTRSNVALSFRWTGAAQESTRGGQREALPWGNLTLPVQGWQVERGLSAAPRAAGTTAIYLPPGSGEGVDRYVITVDPEVVLDPAWPAPASSLDLALSYAQRDGETVVGIDQTAHNPRSEGTPLVAPFAMAALGVAVLLRRRH